MQQLLKPSLNFDFKDVLFEDNLQQTYQINAQQKNDHQLKNQNKKGNQKAIIRPLSSSGQRSSQNKKDLNRQNMGVDSKPIKQQQSSPQPLSAKQVKFENNKTLGTTPSIQSNCYFPQQHNILPKQPISSKQQQMDNKNNKQQSQKQNSIQNAGIFDWDDDEMDNNFYISENPTMKIHNQKYESIEKANLQQFLQKQKKSNVIETSIKQNQEILKQQQKEIQQKLDNIEQLRMNELLQNNLVLSQVPNLEEEEYNDDFEQEQQTSKQPIQKNEINIEKEYNQENFEKDQENKVINKDKEIQKVQTKQLEVVETKQSEIKLDNVQDNSKKVKSNESLTKKSKKVVYKAKNAKERKQEIMDMRSGVEKYLLQNNTNIFKMLQELQETKDKERIMIEVSTKRQEELSQAKLTLKQLQEKFGRQQQIIEELNMKEHHANQIIQKLTENKQKYNQQWEHQMEKYMACKVIARFLKGRKDRKLFKEFRRQSFINRLKQ